MNVIKFPTGKEQEVKVASGVTMTHLKKENNHLRDLLASNMKQDLTLMEMVLDAQELLDRRRDGSD